MGEPAKAGPCITDNGNFIIDVDFGPITDPASLHSKLKLLTGVVETGLFIDMAEKGTGSIAIPLAGGLTMVYCTVIAVYFGQEDGTVTTLVKSKQ